MIAPIRLTPTVKALLIVTVAVFLIQHTGDRFLGFDVTGVFGLVPYRFVFDFHFWQIVSYAFLHADLMHLLLNGLMLVFIGSELEAVWGRRRFLTFYFFCAAVAGATYLVMQIFVSHGLQVPMVGASGSIYGLLVAYGIYFGERTLLFMMIFPMKAKHMVMLLGAIEFFSSVFSPAGGLSSVAHLGGMVAGFLYLMGAVRIKQWASRRESSPRRLKKSRRKGNHLRLISGKGSPSDQDPDDSDPKIWH